MRWITSDVSGTDVLLDSTCVKGAMIKVPYFSVCFEVTQAHIGRHPVCFFRDLRLNVLHLKRNVRSKSGLKFPFPTDFVVNARKTWIILRDCVRPQDFSISGVFIKQGNIPT